MFWKDTRPPVETGSECTRIPVRTCVRTMVLEYHRVPWYTCTMVRTGVLQGTVTPRRRAQGGDAGSGSYPSLLARRHCRGDSAVDLAVEAVV